MARQRKTRTVACALAALGLLIAAGDAAAQSDGVFVDPDTPAGKEYALPLDKARQDAAPNSDAQESGDTELFGAGISKRGGGGGKGEGQTGDAAATGDGKQAGGSQGDTARSVATAAAPSNSGISSGWLTALIAAGVLLVGGIAGLSLRALRAT